MFSVPLAKPDKSIFFLFSRNHDSSRVIYVYSNLAEYGMVNAKKAPMVSDFIHSSTKMDFSGSARHSQNVQLIFSLTLRTQSTNDQTILLQILPVSLGTSQRPIWLIPSVTTYARDPCPNNSDPSPTNQPTNSSSISSIYPGVARGVPLQQRARASAPRRPS